MDAFTYYWFFPMGQSFDAKNFTIIVPLLYALFYEHTISTVIYSKRRLYAQIELFYL